MATFQFTSSSGAGTVTKTLTYSGPDAQRIFTAWSNIYWYGQRPSDQSKPSPTIDDFTAWVAEYCGHMFTNFVTQNETTTTTPVPPVITGS